MKKLLTIFAAALTLFTAAAQTRMAVVETSSNFLREAPGYEEENGAQLLMGTVVQILDRKSYWVKVKAPDYTGWTNAMTLTEVTPSEAEAWKTGPRWICTAEYSHVYSEPADSSLRVCDLTMGDLLRKAGGTAEGWTPVALPSGRRGWVRNGDLSLYSEYLDGCAAIKCKGAECDGEALGQAEDAIVATALKMNGTPYMWGGNTIKYFDCSGLVSFVYRMNGIMLPRNASQQVRVGEPVKRGSERRGDLLFFGSINSDGTPRATHVGIYIGDGRMIHASQLVRINSLDPAAPDGYSREPIAIRRILGHAGETGIRILE